MIQSESDVHAEIASAEGEFDLPALRLWHGLRIPPGRWSQPAYPDVGPVWVVGVVGTRCLCFNPVEEGWGWARFAQPGVIEELHYETCELAQVIRREVAALDGGGTDRGVDPGVGPGGIAGDVATGTA